MIADFPGLVTDPLIKCSAVKLVLWAQTTPLVGNKSLHGSK